MTVVLLATLGKIGDGRFFLGAYSADRAQAPKRQNAEHDDRMGGWFHGLHMLILIH